MEKWNDLVGIDFDDILNVPVYQSNNPKLRINLCIDYNPLMKLLMLSRTDAPANFLEFFMGAAISLTRYPVS